MSILDQIHNYYEAKVVLAINDIAGNKAYDSEQMADLACLALNNLPTRYFRHEVDLAFYMSAHEHEDIDRRVKQSVMDAIAYVEKQKDSRE
jgi:competence protein ComFB